jgi:hypothetical protein
MGFTHPYLPRVVSVAERQRHIETFCAPFTSVLKLEAREKFQSRKLTVSGGHPKDQE